MKWADQALPSGCKADEFSIVLERAHCFELMNEPQKSVKIYEQILEKNPQNSRAHFLLEGLKRRMRDKTTQLETLR